MYNKVDTIIAKARYTLSLPTLICTTGLFSQVWCLGRVYPFIHQVAKILFYRNKGGGGGASEGGGEREKRDTFPVSKKNKTLDHGFGLCVCTTSKRVEKCRQLGAKPPHSNVVE